MSISCRLMCMSLLQCRRSPEHSEQQFTSESHAIGEAESEHTLRHVLHAKRVRPACLCACLFLDPAQFSTFQRA